MEKDGEEVIDYDFENPPIEVFDDDEDQDDDNFDEVPLDEM